MLFMLLIHKKNRSVKLISSLKVRLGGKVKKNLIYIVLVPLILYAGTITKTLTFSQDQLHIGQVNGFDVPQLAKFGSTQEVGKPLLPEAVFNVLVPATATVTNIEVISTDKLELTGQYQIHPVQPSRPISTKTIVPFIGPDKATYHSSAVYPSQLISSNYTGTKSGYRICGFAVYPMQYVPSTGKLTLNTKMVLRITYEEGKVTESRLSTSQKELFSKDVRTLVINPEDVEIFAPMLRVSDNPDLDYVIITGNSFVSDFQPLADWRTKKGFKAEVKTVDWIMANYSGRDTQERIRNFIIDYFTNHGLKYVLLAGDNAIVPGRRARAVVGTSYGNIPSDLYYSDLQWSWDANNNNIFGEAGSDTVDFFADVYVGRASVDNTNQVTNFINKINSYEKNPNTTYLKKALFPSVMLWSSSGYHGRVVNQIIAGVTPVDWQDDSIISPSNTQPMFNAINNGYHFAHPAAHGDATGLYTEYGQPIYTTTTASAQSNGDKLLIMNSIACISGNFESSDCLAEACMNNSNGGTVAAIMNSREGWGTPPSIGPSENLDIEFYDFFFNYDSIEIGMAHARSKDYFAYQAQFYGIWRWCVFELNLFGDPEMPMWSDVPQTMTVSNPDTVQTGARNLQVTVTTSGSPTANVLVCAYKSGEVFAKGRTNGSGQVNLTINAITPGTMYLTATGKNRYPVEKTITVITGTAQPYLTFHSLTIDDAGQANPNNHIDPGETVNLIVTLKNMGTLNATNVIGKLRTSNSYMSLIDSTSDYGSINQNDTARGDVYRLSASSSTPPGTNVDFTVYVVADQGNWQPNFSTRIGELPQPGMLVADLDTGYCKLSVTCLGSIGFDQPQSEQGTGFCYPKNSLSQLYYGSMMAGNATNYVVDRFYGVPASDINTDWSVVDSLRYMTPAFNGDEELRGSFIDAGHSTPKGLKVYQNTYATSGSSYDDFIVLVYKYKNTGATAINSLYSGIISDFDIPSAADDDAAGTNSQKRAAYMRNGSSQNPTVGIKLLAPTTSANLTVVDHDIYVYPTSQMTEQTKFQLLNGQISVASSNRNYDWSVVVSAGPFNLDPDAEQLVAYAIIGGSSEAEFLTNCDNAQDWFDNYYGIAENKGHAPEINRAGISIHPNPFARSLRITYDLPRTGLLKIAAYDVSGRQIATIINQELTTTKGNTNWSPKSLPSGIYVLRIETPDRSYTQKVMLLR
jgi:hypothetical protein